MAPEQWRGEEEDERTDLFAAAVLLHEMLSGELPYPMVSGRSAALEPGPAPVLRRPGVPRALSSLVAAGLSKDPAGRPRNAQVWLDGLFAAERALASPRSRRERMLLPGAAVLAAVALASGAFWLLGRGKEPSERVSVSVADFANDTDERDLSGLSGMLVTSLEQSRRLSVMTRSRMFDVMRQLGREPVERIDEPLAREIGQRSGVRALLLASIRRFDRVYSIELRALDPAHDEYLFTLREEGEGKAGIPAMIDRLSERTRRALRERPPEIRSSEVKVAEVTTPNLEAYQHYFLGQECMDRPSRAGSWTSQRDCAEEFRKALALDPAFALAHYQLAYLASAEHRPSAERDAEMRAALRHIDRAPPKEQLLIRAWNAHLDGRDDEALRLYREVIDSFPDQKQALYLAGDLLYHRDDLAAAVPHLEKVLDLDPYFEWPLDHLAQALGALRLREALAERVRRWRELQPIPAVLHALTVAQAWLGDPEGAVATARRAVAAGGGPAAGEDLVRAYLFADRLPEAEAELRKAAAPGAPLRPIAYAHLANVLATQGRRAEGRKVLDALGSRLGSEPADVAPLLYSRVAYDTGDGDPTRLWRESSRLAAVDPSMAAEAAVFLAYLGDLEHAAALAGPLSPGSAAAETYAAVVEWKKGGAAEAMERLRALDARNPLARGSLAPSFLLGEAAAATGRDREAIEALRRYQSLWPLGVSRSWAYPRSLLLVSRSLERLGERDRARREVDRLLALWQRADPDLEMLREARQLRARVLRGAATVPPTGQRRPQ
jgi:tetratricopeptide (TPR) repeat protein